jgi:hypothetical protein
MVIGTCEVSVPEAYVMELIDDWWIISKLGNSGQLRVA